MLPNTSMLVHVPNRIRYSPKESLLLMFRRLLVYWIAFSKMGAMLTAKANLRHHSVVSNWFLTVDWNADERSGRRAGALIPSGPVLG